MIDASSSSDPNGLGSAKSPNVAPLDPEILQFIRNLAIADARRDHLIATGQLTSEGTRTKLTSEHGGRPRVRLRKVDP